jgi:hypothetical protein
MRTLFLAWQDPQSRRWYPVGRLESLDGLYSFTYTKGAEQARREAGFEPLTSFPELYTIYESEQLFPLFSNRLLPRSRPEYRDYFQWLSIPENERDPIAILARSGGKKVTDTLEVFPGPQRNDRGEYEIRFLVHGITHLPEESVRRAANLKHGDELLAMHDFQNPSDPDAVALRTAETFDRDMYLVGYCPRYLRADILWLLRQKRNLRITVERVNLPPAPVQFRVLCNAFMDAPADFSPFNESEYDALVSRPNATEISLPPRHYRT